MGRKIIDRSGQTINGIKVISLYGRVNSNTYWICECPTCKKQFKSQITHLYTQMGCGCMKGKTQNKWENYEPKLYKKWNHLKSRCNNPNDISYRNYGGRGIKMCDEWNNFDFFCEWAKENGYRKGLEIDRIDVNGDYEPNNCRFVTRRTNANNKRTSTRYMYHGEIKPLSYIADDMGISYKLLWQKANRNGLTDVIRIK